MTMNELLMPAGSIEKMKYAFAYGADACYLGLVDFSLRALRKGELIDENNLKTAVEVANSLNKKVYCTLNIFAYDKDIDKLHQAIDVIKEAKEICVFDVASGDLRSAENDAVMVGPGDMLLLKYC